MDWADERAVELCGLCHGNGPPNMGYPPESTCGHCEPIAAALREAKDAERRAKKAARDGGPAFPTDGPARIGDGRWSPGMSLRDYFASQAMAGMCADSTLDYSPEGLETCAYRIADAMIAAREVEQP